MKKMVPEGRLRMRPFQFHLKEHWRQPPSLVRDHFSSPRVVAKLYKHEEGHRPSPPRPHYPNLYDASNKGWGAHLQQVSTKGLWSERVKELHINVLKLKAVSVALVEVQEPVSKSNSVG